MTIYVSTFHNNIYILLYNSEISSEEESYSSREREILDIIALKSLNLLSKEFLYSNKCISV